jgi:hypothetical protein
MWNGKTTSHAPYQVPNPGQLLQVDNGTWYATLGGQGQQVVAHGKHNLLLDDGGRVAEGGVALFGAFALHGNLAAVGWNVFGPRDGPTAHGQRKNPNLGEQNEHEDPAFAVIRLVKL